jgi:anti-sigma factor RsiW
MSEPRRQLSPSTEADLVALAGGNLDPARRKRVEARVAAHPVLAAALEGQRAALGAISAATAGVTAPPAVRSCLDSYIHGR